MNKVNLPRHIPAMICVSVAIWNIKYFPHIENVLAFFFVLICAAVCEQIGRMLS
jgi:hypothetical protein